MSKIRLFYLCIFISLALLVSACAPILGAFEGSTETFENTTDALTDVTSSTSPRDKEKKEAEIQQFTKVNFARLRSDMAVGQGEHLTSLAVLMEIDDNQKAQFYRMTKERFDRLFSSSETTSVELVANIRAELQNL